MTGAKTRVKYHLQTKTATAHPFSKIYKVLRLYLEVLISTIKTKLQKIIYYSKQSVNLEVILQKGNNPWVFLEVVLIISLVNKIKARPIKEYHRKWILLINQTLTVILLISLNSCNCKQPRLISLFSKTIKIAIKTNTTSQLKPWCFRNRVSRVHHSNKSIKAIVKMITRIHLVIRFKIKIHNILRWHIQKVKM